MWLCVRFQMDIIGIVTRLPSLVFGASRCDDSFADRVSYKYTVLMLVLFAIIVTNKQFGTKHIQCKCRTSNVATPSDRSLLV